MILVGTDLQAPVAPHSGFIDLFDATQGVRGWAVDHADPRAPVRLLLCVGEHAVAETVCDSDRDDISAGLGLAVRAGFSFGGDAMRSLSAYLDDPDDVLSIRVADTGHLLPSAGALPTLGELVARLDEERLPEQPSTTADFELLLDELRAAADPMVLEGLRPSSEGLQGYVETLAVDSHGQVWFMGWMRRGHLHEFSAVVAERQKYPAAVAVMSYARDDLPADCYGVVGLISSSAWKPNSATNELYLYFGRECRFHLKSHTPLRMITSDELIGEYEGIRERCFGDGRTASLQRMMTTLESWLPTRTPAQWFATACSIDRILLVPGLGCLVEGWVLSPMKRVETLRLRVGARVMSADRESLFWKPRPDLLAAYPGGSRMVDRAGFVGMFAGAAEAEDFSDPVLKIVFQGGASANWAVDTALFRRLGHSASVEDALLFFPALQDEAFFPRFAAAAIQAERAAMNPPVVLSAAPARRAMVLVLPEDRCDLFLLFEELAQQCRTGGAIEAVVFVAASRSNRSDALWLFREFQAIQEAAVACSLLVIDDAAHAFALLPEILRATGVQRFVFCAAGVFLRAAGWARARDALADEQAGLVFFEVEADASGQPGVSARCFAWSAGPLARWAQTAPAFMGGYYCDNGLLVAAPAYAVQHDAAGCTRVTHATKVAEAINAAVYRSAAPVRAAARMRAGEPVRTNVPVGAGATVRAGEPVRPGQPAGHGGTLDTGESVRPGQPAAAGGTVHAGGSVPPGQPAAAGGTGEAVRPAAGPAGARPRRRVTA